MPDTHPYEQLRARLTALPADALVGGLLEVIGDKVAAVVSEPGRVLDTLAPWRRLGVYRGRRRSAPAKSVVGTGIVLARHAVLRASHADGSCRLSARSCWG